MAAESGKRRKPSIRARVLLAFVSVAVALIGAEITTRLFGARPGYVPRYEDFRPVASLEATDKFFTDDEGVFKANPNHAQRKPGSINAAGFRSPPFVRSVGTDQSILFLGDSFTFGNSASPIDQCFVDRVRTEGFVCHNAGVPGTGPGQYAQLAEKWVPTLRPDVVATMIYLGNDINRPLDHRKPNARLWWCTNAGWLRGCDGLGNYYASAAEAYTAHLSSSNLIGHADRGALGNAVRDALTSTVLGSYVWVALSGTAPEVAPARRPPRDEMAKALRGCLERIRRVANAHGARAVFVLLPAVPRVVTEKESVDANKDLFEGFDPHVAGPFEPSDYCEAPNNHFNNVGHGKLARFLVPLLGKE